MLVARKRSSSLVTAQRKADRAHICTECYNNDVQEEGRVGRHHDVQDAIEGEELRPGGEGKLEKQGVRV